MGHTYTKITVHVVFSTKNRIPYLSNDCRARVFDYLGGILRGIDCDPHSINGVADHVHFLFRIPSTLSVADAIRVVKTNSSCWIHENAFIQRSFAWQTGYSAFSISESQVNEVVRYLQDQEAHHRKMTFQEETIAFLKQHGLSYNEKYLWT